MMVRISVCNILDSVERGSDNYSKRPALFSGRCLEREGGPTDYEGRGCPVGALPEKVLRGNLALPG